MTLWKNALLVRWLLLRLLEGCSDTVPAVCLDRQGQLSQPITVHWQAAGRFPLNAIKLSSLINFSVIYTGTHVYGKYHYLATTQTMRIFFTGSL